MKSRAKASTAQDAALVADLIAGLLVLAMGMAYLHSQIRVYMIPQTQELAVPAPQTAGMKDSHSALGVHATGSYS
ncbi:MAG: hypothetical protein V3T02_11410 [Alphaproteobacteria bacterium]